MLVSFTQFGFWQLRRHDQRQARDATTSERLAAVPVAIDEAAAAALADVAAGVPAADAFRGRRATATGTFEPDDEVLRRSMSRNGVPGYHVVTPLALADDAGRRLWVERGWVPQEYGAVPVVAAPPPGGVVVVEGWLRAPDVPPSGWVATLAPRDPPEGRLTTVAYVDLERLSAQVAGPAVPAVLLLAASEPATPAELPLPLTAPVLGPGPHLGYAIQWFAFTLVTLIGYPTLLRRVQRERGDASAATGSAAGG
ncbi:MAG: SURF1 family protein [Trueperaceae bacterium]|nr:SURF1 family protein [Trueperaceae bacterium]